jgi:hypothetical protein
MRRLLGRQAPPGKGELAKQALRNEVAEPLERARSAVIATSTSATWK